MGLQRYTYHKQFTLDTTLADTPAIDFGSYSGGMIWIESTHATVTLTFYTSWAADGTFIALKDSSDAAVTRTVSATGAYAFPDECFGAKFIKITTDADDAEMFHMTFKG